MLRELRDWAEELACRAGVDRWPPAARRLALVAAACAVAFAGWRWVLAPPVERLGDAPAPVAEAGPAAESADADAAGDGGGGSGSGPAVPASVTVHVVGAVRRPGVYSLPATARASDAVQAAGGMLGSADQTGINLARVVQDGEQLVVPVQGAPAAAPAPGSSAAGASPAGGKAAGGASGPVDINTASLEQLDALPGIGPATAQKIVSDRTDNGPFRSVEDLRRIPGIGEKKLESLKGLVTVR